MKHSPYMTLSNICQIDRYTNSANGNPRYRVHRKNNNSQRILYGITAPDIVCAHDYQREGLARIIYDEGRAPEGAIRVLDIEYYVDTLAKEVVARSIVRGFRDCIRDALVRDGEISSAVADSLAYEVMSCVRLIKRQNPDRFIHDIIREISDSEIHTAVQSMRSSLVAPLLPENMITSKLEEVVKSVIKDW